jgi:hypothetical protein
MRLRRIGALVLIAMASGWSCRSECDHDERVTHEVGRHVSILAEDGGAPTSFDEDSSDAKSLDELLAMGCSELCETLRAGRSPDRYGQGASDVHLEACSPVREVAVREERRGRARPGDDRWALPSQPTEERVFLVDCEYSFVACPPASPSCTRLTP